MADGVDITPGSGLKVSTDEVTLGGVPQHVQRTKMMDGTDGGTEFIPGSAAKGLYVDPHPASKRIRVQPTISTSVYGNGDVIGAEMTFAAAARVTGGSGVIQSATLVDRDKENALIELWIFDRSVTSFGSDNAVAAPTETDLDKLIGVIIFDNRTTYGPSDYIELNTTSGGSSIAQKLNVGLPFVANATDLFAQMIVRGTPTYTATSDLAVILGILQD